MLLISDVNADGQAIRNLSQSVADRTSVATNGRVSTLQTNLSASLATLEALFSAAINQLDIKVGCRVAMLVNFNIAIGGGVTTQSVTINSGDRVLLTAQTNPAQNGIYIASVGYWLRAGDANTNAEVTSGMAVSVAEGNTANRALWLLVTPGNIVLGTTALTFQRSRNLHDLTISGSGLNLSSSFVLSLVGISNRISVSGAGIDIHADYIGQTSITNLGTVVNGVWNGGWILVAKGGTNTNTIGLIKLNFGIPQEITLLIGNGYERNFTCWHALNNENIMVSVVRISDKKKVEADVTFSRHSIQISFLGPIPSLNSHKVVIFGIKKPL
jgi:hypothetical protein